MELDKKIKIPTIYNLFSDVAEVKKYYGKEVLLTEQN